MPIPMKRNERGNAKPIFSGTEEAQSADVKMCLCGWCEKEIPADAEVCPFCKRDPRQPGAMADLLDRAEVIRETRSDESQRENKPKSSLGFLDALFPRVPKK